MERKAVKFITVFILSLVLVVTCPLFGFQSEAADIDSCFKTFEKSYSLPHDIVNVGMDGTVTDVVYLNGTFDSSRVPSRQSRMVFNFGLSATYNDSAYNATDTISIKDVTLLYGGKEYISSSNPRWSVSNGVACSVVYDVIDDFWRSEWFSLRITVERKVHVSTSVGQSAFEVLQALVTLTPYSLEFYSASDSATVVTDNVQSQLTQQQTEQQHSDAQDQLKESQKQTDAMTKFDGKSDMDKNSSDLNDSLSGYDDAQQSIFASSTASIEEFDIDNLFNFTVNISAALLVWNNLMVSIVASMGDFSLIYTISMGLVFIGIVVGIWRYFVK